MTNQGQQTSHLDNELAQLRGKLDDLERRVEALVEFAARLPANRVDPSEFCHANFFFDGESLLDEQF